MHTGQTLQVVNDTVGLLPQNMNIRPADTHLDIGTGGATLRPLYCNTPHPGDGLQFCT